jgi:ABC-2 type transport system permease protein
MKPASHRLAPLRELRFLVALWKTNLLSAMEYRGAFLSQVAGMMLNNAMYFTFWLIFFDRFKNVRGWGLQDMLLLFGIVACGFGLGVLLFGNVLNLAEVIASGRLDYYLALPRPVLLHVLASRLIPSGLGDFTYGILSFAVAGDYEGPTIVRFAVASLLSMTVFVAFLATVQALAFWLGNASLLSGQALNAVLVFAMYPITLFDGSARFLLFTLIPAAFIGAVPAEFVRSPDMRLLLQLTAAAAITATLAWSVFYAGVRRYESGSAIGVSA